MNLLLDTQIIIWALSEPEFLPDKIGDLLAAKSNRIYVSPVSIWEISIKFALKRRSSPPFSGTEAVRLLREARCITLNVTDEHAAAMDNLPQLHSDPFDRLLVAQALSEPMRLVTSDAQVAAYSDTIITW